MAFWSTETLRSQVPARGIVVPFRQEAVRHAAYELRLGSEAYLTSGDVKKRLSDGEQISIPPGQFGLLISKEIVRIPDSVIGLISIKSSYKMRGLVNVSGFHVDPGFTGTLHFSVYNAGSEPIILQQGVEVFLLWICNLDQRTEDTYKGGHNDQIGLTPVEVAMIQGDIASPAALMKKIRKLRDEVDVKISNLTHTINVAQRTLTGLKTAVFGGVIVFVICTGINACLRARRPHPTSRPPVLATPLKEINHNPDLQSGPSSPSNMAVRHPLGTRP